MAALLTPTRAPHARLPKHWKGELSPALVRHPLLGRFSHPLLFPLWNFSPQRTSLFCSFFYISERLSSQNVPHAFSRSFLYPWALSVGSHPPQAHPAPLGHGYHDDPYTLKKGGHRSSRKNVAEEKRGRASELVKEMCVNVSVVKKKASHKRGDLSFTLLNASHLRSHETWGWG